MYRGTSKLFKVVYRPEQQYAIWYADAPPSPSWQETGRTGSERECWDYVETAEEISGYIMHFPDKL